MNNLTDEELLNEVKRRFTGTKNSLAETKKLMKRLHEVNRKLEESEELKTNFLSNIRNEINNPLTSIIGLSQAIVTMGGNDHQTVADFAATIYRESFTLDFQLTNIFMSAELESGEVHIKSSRIDLGKLLKDLLKSFQHIVHEKALSIKFIPDLKKNDTGKIVLVSDFGKLHLVLSNLLDNAIEYSYGGSEIKINLEKKADILKIKIQNFGELINIPNKNVIFDRFKQLDSGSTKRHKGHGLGLSLCRDLVEIMGGAIKVKSTESAGNVFQITLPDVVQGIPADDSSGPGDELFFENAEEF